MLVQWVRAWCATGALWLMGLRVVAQDYTYTNINGAISITGTTLRYGLVGAVTIPSTIEGLPVVNIGHQAFVTNWFLTSITIPGSVTNIGLDAFEQSAMTNLTIEEGVITIEGWAFLGCWMLPNVSIPNSVTSIGDLAFNECAELTNITIGSGLTNIGGGALDECYKLSGVYFKGNAPTPGVSLFYYDKSETVYYLPGTKGWGTTFAGAPAKLWNPQMVTNDGSFGAHQDGFGFNIAGTVDIPLVVEASTNLADRSWVPLQTFTLTNGLIHFSDQQWTNYSSRLYRIRSP